MTIADILRRIEERHTEQQQPAAPAATDPVESVFALAPEITEE